MTTYDPTPLHAPTPFLETTQAASPLTWTVMTFEDDTVRILPKNLEQAQGLLTDWYNEIEYFMTLEQLELPCSIEYETIPGMIELMPQFYRKEKLGKEDFSTFTKNEYHVSYKEQLIQHYLPSKLNQLILTHKVEEFEKNAFHKQITSPFPLSNTTATTLSANFIEAVEGARKTLAQQNKEAAAASAEALTHSTIVVETFSSNPSVSVKVPKYFFTKACNKPEEGRREGGGGYPYDFAGWPSGKHGPYGMQSCTLVSGTDERWMSFSQDNYMLLEEATTEIHVFFHLKSMKSFIYVPPPPKGVTQMEPDLKLIIDTPQCGFVKLFTLKMKRGVVPVVNRLLHNKYHPSIEELNSSLDTLHATITLTEKTTSENQKHMHEEEHIKIYIDQRYEILDDLNYKIKASILCQEIARNLLYDPVTAQALGVRLSNYLKDMGLQKKRYNDGYYYYGLKPKFKQAGGEGAGTGTEGGGGGGGGGGGSSVASLTQKSPLGGSFFV
jgi:hypothetical protein